MILTNTCLISWWFSKLFMRLGEWWKKQEGGEAKGGVGGERKERGGEKWEEGRGWENRVGKRGERTRE